MTVYNLPPFGPRASFPPPGAGAVGAWQPASGSLAELAKSLHVGDDPDQAGVGAIRSVPDPWAQVRAFADAILTDHPGDHPLHRVSISQWRGLIALFALQGPYEDDYRLTLTPVSLGVSEGDVRRDQRSLFARVLTRLLPPIAIPQTGARTADWSTPVIVSLTCDGQRDPLPLAVLNPSCLVSPGRSSGAIQLVRIPWLARGLSDPTALPEGQALPAEHYFVLQVWLSTLRQTLNEISGGRTPSALTKAIDGYRADCLARISDIDSLSADFKVIDRGSIAYPGDLPPLYDALALKKDLQSIRPPWETSDCLIDLRESLGPDAPIKGVVLFDPLIISALGKARAQDVTLWGDKRLSSVTEGSAAMRELVREVAEAGYFLATPSDFFTNRLCRLHHSANVDGHENTARQFLLPLSPLALLLHNPRDLRSAIDIADQGDRATVTLKLRLSSGKQHTMTRRFGSSPRPGEGQLDGEVDWMFGETAVWPNFRSPEWKWNYLRISYNAEGDAIRARFGLSAAALGEMLKPIEDHDLRHRTLKEWGDAERCTPERGVPFVARVAETPWLKRARSLSDSQTVEEYQSTPHGIEAVFFARAPEGAVDPVPVGCALLKADTVEAANGEGIVAIDFGTTNTIACFEDEEPVTFQNRILHPISSRDTARKKRAEQHIRWPFVEFMPPAARTMPTPSVALSRKADDPKVLKALTTELGPLFRSVVYFAPEDGDADAIANKDRGKFDDIIGRARFNLKWSEEEDDQRFAKEYLRQLVMMCAAEAVSGRRALSKLTWRFSKPDAMNPYQVNSIYNNLYEAVQEVAPGGKIPQPCSEGLAAAEYILSGGKGGEFNRGKLNIIVDIGGGTTDVAFWNARELVWSGSYKLAGGQFFTAYLMQNPEFFRRFDLDTWADIVAPNDGASSFDQGKLTSLGELLFSGPQLGERMNKGWNIKSGSPEAKGLQRAALVFLGGIAWRLGNVAKGLVAQGRLNAESFDSIAFALCGRGSGLFSRLHLGPGAGRPNPLADTPISRLLTIFRRAAELSVDADKPLPRPSVFVSATPKTEVVRGMVRMTGNPEGGLPKAFEPSGLTIPLGGDAVLAADADIYTAGLLANVGYPDLKEFEAFLDALADCGGLRLDLKKGQAQGGFARIQTSVQDAVEASRTGLREPPFITALRVLVADLARNERERGDHLTIGEA